MSYHSKVQPGRKEGGELNAVLRRRPVFASGSIKEGKGKGGGSHHQFAAKRGFPIIPRRGGRGEKESRHTNENGRRKRGFWTQWVSPKNQYTSIRTEGGKGNQRTNSV